MENDKKENCLILGITLLLVLSGIALRLYGLRTRNLEYDEIWTFAHYVKLPLREIFTELAVPNNHPLNTLFIKYSVRIAGAHQLLQLRLPALLAGLFLLGGSWFALRRLTRSTAGACFGMLLLALNIPLIHYSQTARGYELQALFTAGVMLSLIFFELDRTSQYRRILWSALFLISAVATCLSVTSGVIFVTALALSYVCLFTDFRKLTDMKEWLARKELLTAFFFFAVFVILWYGLNYRTLAQGQSFGNTVTSPVKFLTFVWNTVTQLPLTLTIPAVLAASVLLKDPFKRRVALMGLFSTALVFCSALIFKAGDFRVYIPLIPILAFPAALIFESLTERLRRFSLLVFCLLTVIVVIQSNAQYPKMNPPDLGVVFVTAAQAIPAEALVIYSPTDSYVIASLFRKEFQMDQLRRIKAAPVSLILMGDTDSIGIFQEWKSNTSACPVPANPLTRGNLAGEIAYSEYLLRPLQSGESLKEKFLVVLIDEPTLEQFRRYLNFFKGQFQTANIFCFMTMGAGKTTATPMSRTRVLLYQSPEQSVEQMLALQAERNSAIRFFVIGEK